jgi:hypothetical protein
MILMLNVCDCMGYPLYAIRIPEELHTKMQIAIAQKKLSSRAVAGYVRYFLMKMVESTGQTFSKGYEESMKDAVMLQDTEETIRIIQSFLVEPKNVGRAEEGTHSGTDPSETGPSELENVQQDQKDSGKVEENVG